MAAPARVSRSSSRWRKAAEVLGIVVMFCAVTGLVFQYFQYSYSFELMLSSLLITIGMLSIVVRLFGDTWLRACGITYLDTTWFKQTKELSWDTILLRQVALAFGGWCLCLVFHYLPVEQLGLEDPMYLLASMMVIVCLCLAAFSTHHMGGIRYHGWNFYQPLVGGPAFVLLQGFSWTLFGISLFLVGLNFLCHLTKLFNLACFSCIPAQMGELASLSSASGLGVVSEIMLAVSVCMYNSDKHRQRPRNETKSWLKHHFTAFLFCFVICKPELVLFGMSMLSLRLIMPLAGIRAVVMLWVMTGVAYGFTYKNSAHTSGRRSWPAAINFLKNNLFDNLFVPFFSLRFIRTAELPPAQTEDGPRYIFGYHPHGIVPLTAAWATLTSAWENMFPGIVPAALTSTIIHSIPFARDLSQWCAGYDVSKIGFKNALDNEKSVLLIPGGQYEMIDTDSTSTTITINSRHKGFVRIAIKFGASLVPMYSFGESQVFDNLPFPRFMQLWCMKKLRANLLTFPYGSWLVTPRRVPITIVVADALPAVQADVPTEDQVDLVYRRYFSALEEVFEQNLSLIHI
eukprot:TRINITY_DN14851_c0_g1_i2.p1 TRINITY_DN14851_c0_g1~~TRINITY_DN14851_c0_g1_i2.p1  ORF type:complete len:571 (+),score=97.47 TRINITY_DN14851_c0_g1_i2:37-1749(+)